MLIASVPDPAAPVVMGNNPSFSLSLDDARLRRRGFVQVGILAVARTGGANLSELAAISAFAHRIFHALVSTPILGQGDAI